MTIATILVDQGMNIKRVRTEIRTSRGSLLKSSSSALNKWDFHQALSELQSAGCEVRVETTGEA